MASVIFRTGAIQLKSFIGLPKRQCRLRDLCMCQYDIPVEVQDLTTALILVGIGLIHPLNFLHAGITKRSAVTVAETGFPGSPKMSFFVPLNVQVANLVGFL